VLEGIEMSAEKLKNHVYGKWLDSSTARYLEIVDSTNGQVVALCPDSTMEEVDSAIAAAKQAFPSWRNTIPTRRADILYTLRDKLIAARDELAKIIVLEHGKTLSDAKGELMRAIQYVEHPCGIPELLKGSMSEDVGTGVDEYYIREPLGVFSILPPFNFPAMIALYFTWPVACGNTVVIKPSELCPMTMLRMMQIAQESGFPPGVLNIINGGPDVGNRLCTHPDIVGVTFVGSSRVAELVYKNATGQGKRAQCQGGAKNHVFIMDDSPLDEIIPNIVNSCFGHTSQRCFAVSNVLIHENVYDDFVDKFVNACKALKLGSGMDPRTDMGPIINQVSLDRLHQAIDRGIKEGARMILDGRNPEVPDYPDGFFIGPTLLEAEPDMSVFQEEVFGPVRCLKKVSGMKEALNIINKSSYGHTAVIYTESGGLAHRFIREANTGQVGVNVGTPAPIAFYPVGGRRTSFYGSHRGRANDAVDFYTDKKVVVTRWNVETEDSRPDAASKKPERSSVVF
jgi:malonate-semialdehyde dehydrogenase (acetylating) / methylmalonate-semialdehyde dehydrogenase